MYPRGYFSHISRGYCNGNHHHHSVVSGLLVQKERERERETSYGCISDVILSLSGYFRNDLEGRSKDDKANFPVLSEVNINKRTTEGKEVKSSSYNFVYGEYVVPIISIYGFLVNILGGAEKRKFNSRNH